MTMCELDTTIMDPKTLVKMLFLEKEPSVLSKLECCSDDTCTLSYEDATFEITPCLSVHDLHKIGDDFDAILYDISLDDTPLKTFNQIINRFGETPIIVLTDTSKSDSTINILKHGACDYIFKGFDNYEKVLCRVAHVVENHKKLNKLRAISKSFL